MEQSTRRRVYRPRLSICLKYVRLRKLFSARRWGIKNTWVRKDNAILREISRCLAFGTERNDIRQCKKTADTDCIQGIKKRNFWVLYWFLFQITVRNGWYYYYAVICDQNTLFFFITFFTDLACHWMLFFISQEKNSWPLHYCCWYKYYLNQGRIQEVLIGGCRGGGGGGSTPAWSQSDNNW